VPEETHDGALAERDAGEVFLTDLGFDDAVNL
jgi:hypothetical protein